MFQKSPPVYVPKITRTLYKMSELAAMSCCFLFSPTFLGSLVTKASPESEGIRVHMLTCETVNEGRVIVMAAIFEILFATYRDYYYLWGQRGSLFLSWQQVYICSSTFTWHSKSVSVQWPSHLILGSCFNYAIIPLSIPVCFWQSIMICFLQMTAFYILP